MKPYVRASGVGKVFRHQPLTAERLVSDFFTRVSARVPGRRPAAPGADLVALRDVSFTIDEGERLGVLGPNGSGKSTLLRILSGILKPTSGTVEIRGSVGAVLQIGAGFHPDMTGRDNILFKAAIHRMPRREILRRFDAIVAFAGLERFVDMPLRKYSSGMAAKLAFSVTVHMDHSIYLLDETLAVGDLAFRQKCHEKFQEITRNGKMLVLVSHELGSLRQHCNRAVFLKNGTLVADGSVEDTVRAYESHFASERAP